MPDVKEIIKMIHINQVLNSKICNKTIENHCKSDYGQNLVNKPKKGQVKLNCDLNNMQYNHRKT